MKKALAILSAVLATLAHATGYTDWFTPSDNWVGVKVPVKILVNDGGSPAVVDFDVNITSSLNTMLWILDEATAGLSESAKNAFKVSRLALANSLYASCQANMNKLKIDNLGAALEGVFVAQYGQYVDESGNVISRTKTGVDTSKLRQQLLANKNAIVSGGQAAGGSEANPLTLVITQKPYDESQFEQHTANGRSLTSLKGWYGLSNTGVDTGDYTWAFSLTDFWFPITSGKDGTLNWGRWNGCDAAIFSAGDDVSDGHNDRPLRLRGWYASSPSCRTDFQTVLTNDSSGATADRRNHWILTRYKDGDADPVLHWMKFDPNPLKMSGETVVDDHSVAYEKDSTASSEDPKKVRIKGFEAANTAAASNPKNAKLPVADGSTDLAWKKPVDLFNSSVFDDDASGKVVLKATVVEDGKTEVMTIRQSSSGGEVTSQSLEGKTMDYLTDNASLGAVEVSGDDKIGIKSWDRPQDAKANYTVASRLKLAHNDALDNPTLSPAVVVRDGGTLKYAAIGTIDPIPPIDNVSITTNASDGAVADGVMSIFGYDQAIEGDFLHMGADGLEWMPIADYDGVSIETNDMGLVGLVGFDDAVASVESASDGAVLPFVDASSSELQWAGIMDFFADSVFRQSSETGKILLNGTSEEGKVKVLAMTGNGGDDQHVSALTFDARSVDGSAGIVQVHAFDTAPSPFTGGATFTDALTNMSISVANMSVPLRVPAASGGYEMAYAPLAKITGIPAAPVDDITIELNETDPLNPYLQLHGAAGEGIELETGDLYMIGSDGKGRFGKFGADGDDSEAESGFNSLESYTNTDGERFFRIKDWDTAYETPHVLGKDGSLKYYEVNGGGGVETYSSGAGDQLQLSGYDTAANGALPYKVNDGNGISWLAGVDDRVPLLHNSGAPTTMAIGGSLDKANVSAVPTLNVNGFTAGGNCTAKLNKMLSDPSESSNRSAHQFMARYSSGGSTPTVHWVSIDDVIGGGGSPVDDTSITTNTSHGASSDGVASIFGFSTASAGDIPHKTDDGKIEWKPVASGGALIVEGTSGSTVTSATCTNKLSFVSASDSNVKFTVTDKGNGNVEVKIGVYYK